MTSSMDRASGREKCEMAFLNLLRVLASLAAIGACISYGVSFVGAMKTLIKSADTFEYVWYRLFLNLYGLLFGFLIVLIEIRYEGFLKRFPAFKNWAIRGFYYVFVAILSFEVANSYGSVFTDPDAQKAWQTTNEVFSYILVGIGGFYILGEILCLRKIMQSHKQKYVKDGAMLQSSLV